jgi:hypothetical protein
MEEGYAQHLLIPAFGQVFDMNSVSRIHASTHPRIYASTHIRVHASTHSRFHAFTLTRSAASTHQRISALTHYPSYFEDTHIEILEAKKMMDKAGFKSAIFVSSPFHMRRIKIIAEKVFDKGHVTFVATRYEKAPSTFWLGNSALVRNVTNEYAKINWFLTYRIFNQSMLQIRREVQPGFRLTAC